jgi:hypothetical protein
MFHPGLDRQLGLQGSNGVGRPWRSSQNPITALATSRTRMMKKSG